MSSQAEVHSIEALKDFRVALALYGEDTLAALGAVEAEIRRTIRWLQQDRPVYWQEQIKRRREQVAAAKAEVFRRKLQKKPDYSSLDESSRRRTCAGPRPACRTPRSGWRWCKKWQPLFHQAVLEYHGSIQRLKDLAAGGRPPRRQPAHPDHRRPRGLPAGRAPFELSWPATAGAAAPPMTAPAEFESNRR